MVLRGYLRGFYEVMKGVAFELEFLVFLGKKTGEKNLVFLGVFFFERRRLLSLRSTIIGKSKRPVWYTSVGKKLQKSEIIIHKHDFDEVKSLRSLRTCGRPARPL